MSLASWLGMATNCTQSNTWVFKFHFLFNIVRVELDLKIDLNLLLGLNSIHLFEHDLEEVW